MNLARIVLIAAVCLVDGVLLLRPLHDGDRVEAEQVAQIFLEAPDFAAGQRLSPVRKI